MYKIGVDLPIGTYQIKNELFHAVSDLAYESYHGNEEKYLAEVNRCDLRGRKWNHTQSKDERQRLGWASIEIDNQVNKKRRSVKIIREDRKIVNIFGDCPPLHLQKMMLDAVLE